MKTLMGIVTACLLTFSANAEACGCKEQGGTCERCEKGQCECEKGKCACKDCDCPKCHKHPDKSNPTK